MGGREGLGEEALLLPPHSLPWTPVDSGLSQDGEQHRAWTLVFMDQTLWTACARCSLQLYLKLFIHQKPWAIQESLWSS